jgi:molecular chaperone GrpE
LDVVLKLNSTDPGEREEGQENRELEVTDTGPGETGPGETAGPGFQATAEAGAPDSGAGARETEGLPAGAGRDDADPADPADAGTLESADGPAPPGEPSPALTAEISVAVRELADSSQRYHARAEQREAVIDHLRDEVDRLRRGERRGLLRPLLADMCRLRDDLLKQAATLPAEFDAAKAAALLQSYAETIEITLESNGVITYTPDSGDSFNPRLHRRVSGEPTAETALAGHIAAIRRDGYLDIEANNPIAPAEVTVYAVTKGEQEQ